MWLAPGNLAALYPSASWPADFKQAISDRSGGFQTQDLVKACLTQSNLTALWNGFAPAGGMPHCHTTYPSFRVHLGYDGDLLCDRSS